MMSKIEGDQLRMIVWSLSRTRERPLRSSSSLLSTPALSTPISAETTKMPPSVTTSMTMRNAQPASPPIVPESSVRISDSQNASTNDSGEPPSGVIPVTARKAPAMMMISSERTASQPISAIGPGRHGLVELVAQARAERDLYSSSAIAAVRGPPRAIRLPEPAASTTTH